MNERGNQMGKTEDYSSLNLFQKLAKIRAQVDVMKKTRSGYGYKYTPLEDILARITVLMTKYGVSLLPAVREGTAQVDIRSYKKAKFTKTGEMYEEDAAEYIVRADTSYQWVNDDNPNEAITVPWIIVGAQADPSQAFGGGMSYGFRYFLTNYFQISQTDTDLEQWRKKKLEAEEAEDKAIAAELIATLDTLIKSYLANNPTSSETVKDFISKYVKNGNYFAITESALAGKLLEEFKTKFSKEETT